MTIILIYKIIRFVCFYGGWFDFGVGIWYGSVRILNCT